MPFGGVLDSGTGTRFGGTANLDAFTETRCVTMRGDIAPYPFNQVGRHGREGRYSRCHGRAAITIGT